MTIEAVLANERTWHIATGDCLDVLRAMPAGCVQCCVTSPPYYSLRDYGMAGQVGLEDTPEAYCARLVEVFGEVRRVLRDDGTLWLNLGDSYSASQSSDNRSSYERSQSSTLGPKRDGLGGNNAAHVSVSFAPRKRGMGDAKPKDLLGIPWLVAFALRADGWYLRSDIIWCLSPSTVVYAKTATTEGPMTIHDIVRLDPATVKLWTGEKWSQVRGWSATETDGDTFRLTLRSGERISCTANHRWALKDGRVLRTEEITLGDELATCTTPEPERPEGDGLEELAWFVGLYLAEGSRCDDCISIAGHAKETDRHARVERIARKYGGSAVVHADGDTVAVRVHGRVLIGAVEHFITGERAHGKHLHPRAWRSSNAVLLALLQGYLDGDGHCDKANGRWRLGFCRNDALAQDLRTLAGRLGLTLTLNPTYSQMGRTRVFESYRGEIRFDQSGHHNCKSRSEVVNIEVGRGGTYYDIGIADEPHFFALASGVLTHNSKPNPMPESVTDRPTKAHEYVFLLSKRPRYFYDGDAIRELYAPATFARQQYGWHHKGPEIGQHKPGHNDKRSRDETYDQLNEQGRNKRSVWSITSEPFPDAHFATYPPALVEPCILAGTSEKGCCPACGMPWRRVTEKERRATRPGQETKVKEALERQKLNKVAGRSPVSAKTTLASVVGNRDPQRHCTETRTVGWEPGCDCNAGAPIPCLVLDPFAGAGTTVLVARRLGRRGLGAELNPEYVDIARRRILNDNPLEKDETVKGPALPLFGDTMA